MNEDNFCSLHDDQGVFIYFDRNEPGEICTHFQINGIGISLDIPRRDFLRLYRAMNSAIKNIDSEKAERLK